MNSSLRSLLPLLGLAAAAPIFAADTNANAVNPQADAKARKELRVLATASESERAPGGNRIFRRVSEPREMEPVTFLGVEAGPVSATLASQLGLTEGNGLVVNHVLPDSPATGMLKQHDILLKFDDQILIEQRQLAVLVRGHKEGDEVTLTYLRGGKQATAKVKLAKHDAPKLTMSFSSATPGAIAATIRGQQVGPGNVAWVGGGSGGASGAGNFEIQTLPPDVVGDREEVNRVLALIDSAHTPGQRRFEYSTGPGDRNISVTVNTGNSRIISNDDRGSLELIIKEGKKEVVAKNVQGEQVFAGPVNTPEERKALPADVRDRLDKLEDMKQYSFRTDADFQGAEMKIMRPQGQGISFPRAPAPARQVLSF